ncbi:unnamed protein product [Notodromas monacha]|uniref:U6 snRNA-associated Sm-like protein LSm7 n=1 Tax=Notodromas monacha TaxID=399045 RepID=A0A7R9BF94_9CRUS|nr:unnamed protein product [Notodromas monacha]CAG0912745.1 unnamed protein product [Notodromas monacha]
MKYAYSLCYIAFGVALLHVVAGLQCYQCTSSEELQCGESLRSDTTLEPSTCNEYDAKFCVKMTGLFEGEMGTKRMCTSVDMGNMCEYITRPGDKREYRSCFYTCSADGCNGAASVGLSIRPTGGRGGASNVGEKKKRESILDLSKYLDKAIRVKFGGGREVSGVLKGFDPLLNLVLDTTTEYVRDLDDPFKLTDDTRQLGLVVCRGTAIVLICPMDGTESIPNPFLQPEG